LRGSAFLRCSVGKPPGESLAAPRTRKTEGAPAFAEWKLRGSEGDQFSEWSLRGSDAEFKPAASF
jgi:hypothetical protein